MTRFALVCVRWLGVVRQFVCRAGFALFGLVVAVVVALFVALAAPSVALAEPNTTIVGLVNATSQLDRQTVTVRGEVVGDALAAEGGHKWLMLQDGGAAISVLVDEDELDKVSYFGRYGQVGTTLEVSGEFQVDCAEHDGLTDLHAATVTVIDEGSKSAHATETFDVRKLEVGVLLFIVGLCLVVLHWRLRERTR